MPEQFQGQGAEELKHLQLKDGGFSVLGISTFSCHLHLSNSFLTLLKH